MWNSGFDANVGVFGCLPRGWGGGGGGGKEGEGEGDWVVFDEYVHASVWDGMRAWESRNHDRSASSSSSSSSSSTQRKSHCIPFKHNDMASLRRVLETLIEEEEGVREGRSTVFVAVESLYSMDGTVAPLKVIVGMLEELFGERYGVDSGSDDMSGKTGTGRRKKREAYLIVDEAHATGIYGPQGRGMVAREGLEESPWILARLVTFGKALAASGGALTFFLPSFLPLFFPSPYGVSFRFCPNTRSSSLYSHFLDSSRPPHEYGRPRLSAQLRPTAYIHHGVEQCEYRSCELFV